MRQLHVVALSADGRSLLLASAPKGARAAYRVAVDARLRTALRGERPKAPEEPAERPEMALSPREIQTRLRAGQAVSDVAKAAGISAERVERYLAPVQAERIQVIDDAQTAHMTTSRRGQSSRALGAAVAVHLAPSTGVELDSIEWSTRRRGDGCWIVRLDYVARARRRSAQWEWDPRTHELAPLDTNASTLGYVDASGGRRTAERPAPARTPAKRTAAKRTARKPAKKTAAKSVTRTAKRTAKKTTKKTATRATTRTAKKTAKRTAKKATARTRRGASRR